MLLLLLIPFAWLAVAAFAVVLCKAASRADADIASAIVAERAASAPGRGYLARARDARCEPGQRAPHPAG